MLISSNKFVLFLVISCKTRHQHLSQNYFRPVEVQYCEKMVIKYTRAALNAFYRYTVAKPFSQDLYRVFRQRAGANEQDNGNKDPFRSLSVEAK